MKSKEEIKDIFDKYVSKYDFENARVKRKYEHTFRVAKVSEDIAFSLKEKYELNDEEIELAYLIGILHDIGKFDQIKMYNTCQDKKSFDHGDYGADLLKNGLIRDFIIETKFDDVIELAIRQHNKFNVEEKCNKKINMYINILRDADKLDIYFEFANKMINIYDYTYNLELTKEVIEKFERNEMINKDITKTKSDEFLSNIAMIYDLNFNYSLKYLEEKKYIDIIFNQIDVKDDAKDFYVRLKNHINNYIDLRR